jgi:hypothetical protein
MKRSMSAILRWAAVMVCIVLGLAVLGSARGRTAEEYGDTDARASARAIKGSHR